jgi:hypothetical protein
VSTSRLSELQLSTVRIALYETLEKLVSVLQSHRAVQPLLNSKPMSKPLTQTLQQITAELTRRNWRHIKFQYEEKKRVLTRSN